MNNIMSASMVDPWGVSIELTEGLREGWWLVVGGGANVSRVGERCTGTDVMLAREMLTSFRFDSHPSASCTDRFARPVASAMSCSATCIVPWPLPCVSRHSAR